MGVNCSRRSGTLSDAVRVRVEREGDEPGDGPSQSALESIATVTAEKILGRREKCSFRELYRDVQPVSYGASSTVVRGVNKETGETVACKIIPKLRATCHILAQRKLRTRVLAEIGTMKTVEGHPNAAKLREVFEDEKNYYLVMDYYAGGELFEHIISRKQGFTEDQAAAIMRDLMGFLAYCHDLGVVHADIKPENIVFSEEGMDGVMKVLDFGLSVFCRPNQTHKNVFGTLGYCSPEMANDVTGQKTDVWSAGVILYFMLCGKPPFRYANKQATLCRLRQKPRVAFSEDVWDLVSNEAKAFIRALLNPNPNKRVSAKQALKMAWLRDSLSSKRSAYKLHTETVESLKVFSQLSRLKRVFWERLARQIPEEAIGDQLAQFSGMDSDGNGVLDFHELTASLKVTRPDLTEAEVNQVFAALDVDKSGDIDSTEFVAATILLLDPAYKEEMAKSSFQRLDREGSGFVPTGEMREALLEEFGDVIVKDGCLADLDVEIETMDANGDGVISFEEFKRAMTETRKNLHLDRR
ncbi:hypothetical protein BSKO_05996 [Bryopsis sp. KO-2023]|nr:hypothetical protein BSKO_05996 [Bryopsis sp. KO-2023]